ncbi:ImmA/IrrE family metallo-endopeptidase [Clostridium botulinum]|nr:ImmA/IrrE family metallo-endopeptidase [Clostridium botulinum]APQ99921.1 hypothetical protein RSJ2_2178 [Clostridium botulinum]AXG94058.1 ImmA/IrrE family metallo-endopeptidase [Clostridium botulinum]NEZ85919.1 ImmA/IrrE family metallo-endopeptidase [Clostridium botulinum]NFE31689.1 ImmA/IrrE family metallo-endopeptidase [Clostridium botulinum]OSA70463.1 hypothetical protein B2H90_00975 [Clostridium botulinum]
MDKRYICDEVKRIKDIFGIIGTKVDPIDIANELNINVYEVDNLNAGEESVSGAIRKENNKIDIFINGADSNERKRFTIAHELGHYFLGHLDKNDKLVDLHRDYKHNPNIYEKEADEFAGCFLMDSDEVKDRFKKAKLIGLTDESAIALLARIFSVSRAAMYVRIRNLGLI